MVRGFRRSASIASSVSRINLYEHRCQTPPESEEEKATDETKKETAKADVKASPFEGEHTDLADGDTATWNAGMAITISDIHIAANETRRLAEENVAKSRGGEKSPGLDGPEELLQYSYTITNEGEVPLNFNGQLPCSALDANGIELKVGRGLTAEQTPRLNPDAKQNNEILKQPLEQGQTRSGIVAIPLPDAGTAELICVHPPQRGGPVNVGGIPEQGRATWPLDPANLSRRS